MCSPVLRAVGVATVVTSAIVFADASPASEASAVLQSQVFVHGGLQEEDQNAAEPSENKVTDNVEIESAEDLGVADKLSDGMEDGMEDPLSSQVEAEEDLEAELVQAQSTRPACPQVSMKKGRCGPKYGGRCNKKLTSYAVYCNSDNGWCGTSSAHKNAQAEDKYDWKPASCNPQPACPQVSMTSGRCGPKYGGRCNKKLTSYAVYCNSDNGWCGTSPAHKNAQAEDKYDWEPASCVPQPACPQVSMTPGRCGPKYGGRCNKKLKSYAVYCNSDNGWCGTSTAHKNAQAEDKYDWEPASC